MEDLVFRGFFTEVFCLPPALSALRFLSGVGVGSPSSFSVSFLIFAKCWLFACQPDFLGSDGRRSNYLTWDKSEENAGNRYMRRLEVETTTQLMRAK
jgi:hypothetical protein